MTKKELKEKIQNITHQPYPLWPDDLIGPIMRLISRHTIMKPSGYMEKRQQQVTGFLGYKPLSAKGIKAVTKELTKLRKKKRTNN